MTTPTPVLEAEGIGKRYGGVTALDDVSVSVLPGEVCGLIGPNEVNAAALAATYLGVDRDTAEQVEEAAPETGVTAPQGV